MAGLAGENLHRAAAKSREADYQRGRKKGTSGDFYFFSCQMTCEQAKSRQLVERQDVSTAFSYLTTELRRKGRYSWIVRCLTHGCVLAGIILCLNSSLFAAEVTKSDGAVGSVKSCV